MIDIKQVYKKSGSTELINKLREAGKLEEVVRRFTRTTKSVNFVIDGDENACHYKPQDADEGFCYFTDYTFVVDDYKYGSNSFFRQTDHSDMWVSFMTSHLQGEAKADYLRGLNKFVDNVAVTMKNEMLLSNKIKEEFKAANSDSQNIVK